MMNGLSLFGARGVASHARARLLAGVVAALWGAAFAPPSFGQAVSDAMAVDRGMIVDCLLPGAVRKLGASVTYLTPRKVERLAVQECEVRGGEYVLFDRADPQMALKIWQPSAAQGDAVAQFRLGQIYEMGVGEAANYQAAAEWYRKAADQGNRAAALNLAVLYEKGLGVPRDPGAAVRLYRKAQGLEADVGDPSARPLQQELKKARDRINQLESEVEKLRQSGGPTSQKEAELNDARATVDHLLDRSEKLPVALFVDVGDEAGAKPSIQLIDPSLLATRGRQDVFVSGNIQAKQIVGRVKARHGLANLTINSRDVQPDRFGLFETTIPIARGGTPVRIVAVDRQGDRDELVMTLKPGRQEATEAARPRIDPSRAVFGEYHALVIGNDSYKHWAPLRTAVNDANAVADLLRRKYGFKVRTLLNATFDQTLNAMNDLVKTLKESDNLLIYYAGHGYFDLGRRGYWIPVDAETTRGTRWILDVHITDLLLKMNARKVMVVADSCYSGVLAAAPNGGVPTIQSGLPEDVRVRVGKQFAEIQSRTVLTSGALQPVWDSGIGKNSVFATAFLDVLRANDSLLEGYLLYEAVEGRVIKASQRIRQREEQRGQKPELESDQTPLYSGIQHAGHQGGDFVFVPVGQRS
jgi:hypothetical protein